MTDKTFRFGVVASPQGGGASWRTLAQRVEKMGYDTLLMPDNLQLLSPIPSLAVAASVTKSLRVGTFVLASPLRPPRSTSWEAHSLSVLTDGRFELGIGTGLPVMKEPAESLGLKFGSTTERLAQVAETIDHLRVLDGERHTPVMMAAAGPKARAMAAVKADIVTLAGGPMVTRDETAANAAELRNAAGARDLELAMNVFVVGEEVPPQIQQFIGVNAATLIEHDSLTMIRGTPRQMADEFERRREAFGVSYISVNGAFFAELAPVVELLAGR
ncbi:MAG: class flavin-dependent oxidoreductase [Amycolatopsis sp.]|jgi:probable F420-dependent oxidoreductase|uniref:LLM class flavin-dependent oxidoreductase n=1 Tax=Amycolatopsis sp. TaxID=37632 RepID=UPI0026026087|nr:LLM class flavin-dependent oxidoreductase [Amycolatopsis sp.]MCU1682384.1 class flavin-dependent oxidoreductase [Amycolatopsis sp.]